MLQLSNELMPEMNWWEKTQGALECKCAAVLLQSDYDNDDNSESDWNEELYQIMLTVIAISNPDSVSSTSDVDRGTFGWGGGG